MPRSVRFTTVTAAFAAVLLFFGAFPADAFHFPWDQGHDPCRPDAPPPPPDDCDKCDATGSPFVVATGMYRTSAEDIFIPGPMPLHVTRVYHGGDSHNGMLGRGWAFNYGIRVIEVTDGVENTLILRRENGQRDRFVQNAVGEYVAPPDVFESIEKRPDGTFRLVQRQRTVLDFDASGNLLSSTDRNGNSIQLTYDSVGFLTSVSDDSGRALTFSKGANGKIESLTDPAGRVVRYSYDPNGNLTGVTDPAGGLMRYVYDSRGLLTQIVDPRSTVASTMTYDSLGRLATYTERQETFRLNYFPAEKKVVETDSQGRTRTLFYNDAIRVTKIVNSDGKTMQRTYDEASNLIAINDFAGNETRFTFDARGNQTSIVDALGNTTALTYEPQFDQVTSITDPRGTITLFEHDANGNTTKVTDAAGTPDETTTVLSYDAQGNIARTIDPLGHATAYEYDDYGNQLKITDPAGQTSTFTYDLRGNLLSETDARGATTTYLYDELNRVTEVIDALGNTTTRVYDASGNETAVTDPAGHTSTAQYDGFDQLIRETDAAGNATVYAYDGRGNLISKTDGNGNVTTYSYRRINGLGETDQLISQTDSLGNVTAYSYDLNGNLTTVTDARGNRTTFLYDALNRVSQIVYPGGTRESFAYDAAGNKVSKTDQNGNTIVYAYDLLSQLVRTSFPDGSKADYSYDRNGNMLTASNAAVAYTFEYDPLNRLKRKTDGTLGKAISYDYLCCNLLSNMTDPEGGVTHYAYDPLKRLTSITAPSGSVTRYTYDNSYRLTRKELPNGAKATYAYDAADRLTHLVNATAAGDIISSFAYTYDRTADRLSMSTLEGQHNYTYDRIHQLTSATHPGGAAEIYTYDRTHNRLSSAQQSVWRYDSRNQLTASGGTTYTHDANGNLLSATDAATGARTSYTYDFENRLTRIDFPDGTFVSYVYDPMGSRIGKHANGTVVRFFYDDEDLLAEYDERGGLIARYTHGQRIDEPLAMERLGSPILFYSTDGLGSITEMTDFSGAIVQQYRYDSFGELTERAGDIENPYMFTARERDEESGLYYYRARYYSPSLGRFTTPDPLGLDAGINLYAYVDNNPVNKVDPYGLKPCNPGEVTRCRTGCTTRGQRFKGCTAFEIPIPCTRYSYRFIRCSCQPKCPPCSPPPPPVLHRVPPHKPHYPCPGDHMHYFEVHQDPVTCKCRTVRRTKCL